MTAKGMNGFAFFTGTGGAPASAGGLVASSAMEK
jgi:hypothetical protein